MSLKALARLVLERDTQRDSGGTTPLEVGAGAGKAGKVSWTGPGHDAASRQPSSAEPPGYRGYALARPVSWADPGLPSPGCYCRCCGGREWWCEAVDPSGWRCATCHPGTHLPIAARREVAT